MRLYYKTGTIQLLLQRLLRAWSKNLQDMNIAGTQLMSQSLTKWRACQKFDSDGVTLYVSCRDNKENNFQQYKYVMPEKLREIVEAHYPPYELDLLGVLQNTFDDYGSNSLLQFLFDTLDD